MILHFRPFGAPNFNNVAIGGDILVLAGTVNLVGTIFVTYNLFQLALGVGGFIAVLGEGDE